jgi:DNA invertase Pin-like site-specific DNA recombinase
MLLGYARLSTTLQPPEHQVRALVAAGVDAANVYLDQGVDRVHWDRLLLTCREGDTVVVAQIDRLGRVRDEVANLLDVLGAKGVGIKLVRERLEAKPAGRWLLESLEAGMLQ